MICLLFFDVRAGVERYREMPTLLTIAEWIFGYEAHPDMPNYKIIDIWRR